jgi:anti-sigma B factor antagonist
VRPLARLSLGGDEEATIAKIEGEVDLSNAEALRQRIAEAVPNGAFGLVVDLSAVGYLDSSGLRLLFDIARRLERRQQRIATVVPDGSPVRELLTMMGGTEPLALRERLDDALSHVRASDMPAD